MLSDVIISINTLAGVLIVSTFIGTIEADTCNAVTVTHGNTYPDCRCGAILYPTCDMMIISVQSFL